MANNVDLERVAGWLRSWQAALCQALADQDGQQQFKFDPWIREQGGGGVSAVLADGPVLERAGVNFSQVQGVGLPPSATAHRPHLAGSRFQAVGVSIVIHPRNPYVPTSHANLRLFVAEPDNAEPIWWFGGGFDLTPFYPYIEDCREWHQAAFAACQVLAPDAYERYKDWCDRYFFLKHRNETRGIGGIFFDDLNEPDFERCFEFVQAVGAAYLKTYVDLIAKRKHQQYGETERQFQLYRRGRYVEFNLIYDRGTLFGLQSGGRTESILVSMPPLASWAYDYQPEPGSPEAVLQNQFLGARDWLGSGALIDA